MQSVKKDKPNSQKSRRDFLQKSVMLGAGVATAAALPTQVLASVEETTKVTKARSEKEEGYRLTKHISDYYKSTQL